VSDDDDPLVFDAVDGVGGDRAACNRFRARSEDARGAGGCLQRAAFVGFGGNHAIEIDQENQAAVRRDGRAGEEFYATEIFAKILDDDFILAENFFDDEADLAVAGVGDDHAEVTVDGLKRRKTEIGVKAHNFGDDVTDFGQKFAADVFDFVGANAADFLDDTKRQRVAGSSATNEERGRDDQGQRNFQSELGAFAALAVDFDFAIELIEVGPNDIEANTTAGEFGLRCGGGEA